MIDHDHLLPIFGVCLGLQSMAVEYGAKLQRLSVVKHGLISLIQHEGSELFKGLSHFNATRYHSLHVQLPTDGEIEELAWADDGLENGKVTMAIKHKSKPFWAVQYHPESVCTTGGGLQVISNFWRLAQNWHRAHGRKTSPSVSDIGTPWPIVRPQLEQPALSPLSSTVQTKKLCLPNLEITRIAETLGASNENSPFVVLDSAAAPGRWSIIGSVQPSCVRIVYFTGDNFLTLVRDGKNSKHVFPRGVNAWSWIGSYMSTRRAQGGYHEVPFWGGLVGYLSYECGLEALTVPPSSSRRRHPDINLIFIERSVVIDLQEKQVYIQSILTHDESWITETRARLTSLPIIAAHAPDIRPLGADVKMPHKTEYTTSISHAKEYLMSGDSYELCLTAQTRISVPRPCPNDHSQTPEQRSWNLYKRLRYKNPAPHAAYLRLGETTVLSASPERFLSFSRTPRPVCQLRPIKGTLRKGPGITRAVAEKALAGNPKEVAENLMIVDLIRHDLYGVLGEDVRVKQFCRVEEYKTVWQLVSVIEGSPPANASPDDNWKVGWDVLQHSLPPGRFHFILHIFGVVSLITCFRQYDRCTQKALGGDLKDARGWSPRCLLWRPRLLVCQRQRRLGRRHSQLRQPTR
jgi:para-aminobenzoate synthetase